ncbi:hypothetical protein L208DRAFT_1217794, partial [Tricholoma matsutake]
QEFHELELLDDITTLLFKGKLPVQVAMGDRRNTMVDPFRRYKGLTYMPAAMHRSICPIHSWNQRILYGMVLMILQNRSKNSWDTTLSPCMPKKLSPADEPDLALKCKHSYIPSANVDMHPLKKLKIDHMASTSHGLHMNVPIGMQWHNNSCAYNATITTLFNIWRQELTSMTISWQAIGSDHLHTLTQSF